MKRIITKSMFAVSAVGMAFLLGCAEGKTPGEKFRAAMRADAAPLSDFLPNHKLMVRQSSSFPFHYFYLKKNAKTYERVYVAPVDTTQLRESSGWAQFDQAMSGKLGTSVDELADYMKQAFEHAFRTSDATNRLQVVDNKDMPSTLVLETAIIAIVPTKAELNVAGTAASFVVPGIGIVTSAMSGGSITIECRVRDAKTGEIIAMYADTETDPKALLSAAQFTWTYTARLNIKEVAGYTAQVLSAKNYQDIERRFPLRWTALIKDTNLDEEKK